MDRTKRIYFSEESDALETAKLAEKADDIAKGRKKDVKSSDQFLKSPAQAFTNTKVISPQPHSIINILSICFPYIIKTAV